LKITIAILTILLFQLSAGAQSKWEFRKEKGGIKMFGRVSTHSRFDDIRVEVDLPGTVEQLAAILLDVEKYPDWAYGTKSTLVVKRISKTALIYYSEFEVPWPATNRDLYASFSVMTDSLTHSLKVISNSVKGYAPEKSNLVRIPLSKGVWIASVIAPRKIHLQYTLELDPGGTVPGWVLNMFSTKGPMETFENLRQKMILLNR
jgi:hypothetical protein